MKGVYGDTVDQLATNISTINHKFQLSSKVIQGVEPDHMYSATF